MRSVSPFMYEYASNNEPYSKAVSALSPKYVVPAVTIDGGS